MDECERLKGSPGNTSEITVVFRNHFCRFINQGFMTAFMQNLYREDLFYADKLFLVYSMKGPDGSEERKTLEKMSERFHRIHKGYLLDRYMHIVAGPEVPVINLRQLMTFLKSKDGDLYER